MDIFTSSSEMLVVVAKYHDLEQATPTRSFSEQFQPNGLLN
jgi:hypothetical protein